MNFSGILIGSEDPERLAAYYTKLLGASVWNQDGYTTWQIGTGGVTVGSHDQVQGPNTHPGRIIWNIETPDVRGEFARFKEAGAMVIREPYSMDDEQEYWIATFADPDDNYFQLVSPMPTEP